MGEKVPSIEKEFVGGSCGELCWRGWEVKQR